MYFLYVALISVNMTVRSMTNLLIMVFVSTNVCWHSTMLKIGKYYGNEWLNICQLRLNALKKLFFEAVGVCEVFLDAPALVWSIETI